MKKYRVAQILAIGSTSLLVVFLAGFGVLYSQVVAGNTASTAHKIENYEAIGEKAPKDCTVFFGDSITELCPLSDVYGAYTEKTGLPVCNRGISAECTPSMLERFDKSVIEAKPKNLVILAGVNDLQQGIPEEETLGNIRQMLERTKQNCPDTNIILQALYPLDETRTNLYEKVTIGKRTNEMIRAFNTKLEQLAAEENVTYLDMTPYLTGDDGNLKKEYTTDGLHPSTAGYMEVAQQLIPYLK